MHLYLLITHYQLPITHYQLPITNFHYDDKRLNGHNITTNFQLKYKLPNHKVRYDIFVRILMIFALGVVLRLY